MLLRDQLLNCPDETLQRALYLALDDRVDTISVVELMKEIKALAMVTKSNIVELPKTPRHTDRGVPVTIDDEGRIIILSPESHSQQDSMKVTKTDKEELNTDRMLVFLKRRPEDPARRRRKSFSPRQQAERNFRNKLTK